jgi:enoyl-CoA hydratase/carnithine racemase
MPGKISGIFRLCRDGALRYRSSKIAEGEASLPEFVSIEKGLGPDGRIAVVRFDRGDGINALSPEALRQLTAVARSFEDDAATSVVVLTGSAKAFSAGFDLKDPGGTLAPDHGYRHPATAFEARAEAIACLAGDGAGDDRRHRRLLHRRRRRARSGP